MDISSHGDAEETEEAKRIIKMEKAMEQQGVKCFVVMANRTDLGKFRGARIQAIREETLEQWMVAPVELVRSVLTEDWSDDYAASEHWSKYWNAVSAPSDDEWPEGLTEDGNKLFLKDKLLVPENRVEDAAIGAVNSWGRGSRRCASTWGFGTPRPWRTTPGRMAVLRWPGGRCLRSSASCTLTNRAGTGITRCGECSRRITTFRDPLDRRPIVSCSYGIECHALSRG